jgi:hypothetical protein
MNLVMTGSRGRGARICHHKTQTPTRAQAYLRTPTYLTNTTWTQTQTKTRAQTCTHTRLQGGSARLATNLAMTGSRGRDA